MAWSLPALIALAVLPATASSILLVAPPLKPSAA
jgi:hypothetical protein